MNIFEEADARLLPGFERRFVDTGTGPVRTLTKGNGPPLLMLHGDPQTHLCWRRIAPTLAERFTVVLTDIRGRGETHKPGRAAAGNPYTKREMADEQLAVMQALGHARFALVGHDRGARVAQRMALDHPQAVTRLAVMDIIPSLDFYAEIDARSAQEYFYFFFLTQPHPVPERLIAGDPEGFMRGILEGLSDAPVGYDELAMRAYLAANTTAEAIGAMCECFRTGYHIDTAHEALDREAGRKTVCPTLVTWGTDGVVGRLFDVRRIWERWCDRPQFAPVDSGHFIPEEAPEAALALLQPFLAGSGDIA